MNCCLCAKEAVFKENDTPYCIEHFRSLCPVCGEQCTEYDVQRGGRWVHAKCAELN